MICTELGMQEMQDGNYKNALTYFRFRLELEKVPNKQKFASEGPSVAV